MINKTKKNSWNHHYNFQNFLCNNGQCIEMRSVCDGTNDCQDASDEKPNICREQPELRSQSFTSLMSFGFTFQRLSRAISSWKCCINLSDSKCKISIFISFVCLLSSKWLGPKISQWGQCHSWQIGNQIQRSLGNHLWWRFWTRGRFRGLQNVR